MGWVQLSSQTNQVCSSPVELQHRRELNIGNWLGIQKLENREDFVACIKSKALYNGRGGSRVIKHEMQTDKEQWDHEKRNNTLSQRVNQYYRVSLRKRERWEVTAIVESGAVGVIARA